MKFKIERSHLQSIGFWLILLMVFAFAYLMRVSRADWGLPYLYYWDEPQTASTALRILKTGNFNPWFFNYGTLPIYINYFVDVFHYLYLMGQPPTAIAYLNSFADIKTVGDTKWIWTISHPSFYYWNRFTTVIFGTASVWLTFLIARNVFGNKWLGLIAALFIASIIPHAQFSALITPDIPMGFFVLATTYFCLRFIDSRQTKYFALALVCVGCGFATKYNSILAVLVPALSLAVLYFQERKKFETKWLIMLPVVPTISFFICMPYAYIDPASFLSGMGFELRHYKIHGHGEFTVGAGIRHIRFQAAEILNNIGIIGAAGVALGLFASLKNPKLLFISFFPLAYFFYMTTTIINFHRNFLVLYPFMAVGYAGAVLVSWRMGNWFATLAGPKMEGITSLPTVSKSVFSILLGGLFVVNVNIMAYWALQDTIKVKQVVDSRTLLIDQINKLASTNLIAIPNELRVHEQDLRRLNRKYELVPLAELFSCAGKGSTALAIVPDRLEAGGSTDNEKELAAAYPALIKRVDRAAARLTVGEQLTSLDKVSVNPQLYLFDLHTLALSNPNCAN